MRGIIAGLSLALAMTACTRAQSERGVEPLWRELPVDAFAIGRTTQNDVMMALGPPSQVITGDGGSILYYLYEQSSSRGLILIVYNRLETETRYERAIFFFDGGGVLQDFSLGAPPGAS